MPITMWRRFWPAGIHLSSLNIFFLDQQQSFESLFRWT